MPGIPTVYILASNPRGTLYIGVTSQLVRCIGQHREGCANGFTKRYGVKQLVWYEQHVHMINAIKREKAIKLWPRQRKFEIVQKFNPEWEDLWARVVER